MPVAATATRAVDLARPRPALLAAAWGRIVAFVALAVEVFEEARAAEREAHRRTPFIDW